MEIFPVEKNRKIVLPLIFLAVIIHPVVLINPLFCEKSHSISILKAQFFSSYLYRKMDIECLVLQGIIPLSRGPVKHSKFSMFLAGCVC